MGGILDDIQKISKIVKDLINPNTSPLTKNLDSLIKSFDDDIYDLFSSF